MRNTDSSISVFILREHSAVPIFINAYANPWLPIVAIDGYKPAIFIYTYTSPYFTIVTPEGYSPAMLINGYASRSHPVWTRRHCHLH